MAATPQTSSLSGLARALVQAGRLKEAEAEQLFTQASQSKISLIEQIVISKKASALDMARFVAETFGYPLMGWTRGIIDTDSPALFRFETHPWPPTAQ